MSSTQTPTTSLSSSSSKSCPNANDNKTSILRKKLSLKNSLMLPTSKMLSTKNQSFKLQLKLQQDELQESVDSNVVIQNMEKNNPAVIQEIVIQETVQETQPSPTSQETVIKEIDLNESDKTDMEIKNNDKIEIVKVKSEEKILKVSKPKVIVGKQKEKSKITVSNKQKEQPKSITTTTTTMNTQIPTLILNKANSRPTTPLLSKRKIIPLLPPKSIASITGSTSKTSTTITATTATPIPKTLVTSSSCGDGNRSKSNIEIEYNKNDTESMRSSSRTPSKIRPCSANIEGHRTNSIPINGTNVTNCNYQSICGRSRRPAGYIPSYLNRDTKESLESQLLLKQRKFTVQKKHLIEMQTNALIEHQQILNLQQKIQKITKKDVRTVERLELIAYVRRQPLLDAVDQIDDPKFLIKLSSDDDWIAEDKIEDDDGIDNNNNNNDKIIMANEKNGDGNLMDMNRKTIIVGDSINENHPLINLIVNILNEHVQVMAKDYERFFQDVFGKVQDAFKNVHKIKSIKDLPLYYETNFSKEILIEFETSLRKIIGNDQQQTMDCNGLLHAKLKELLNNNRSLFINFGTKQQMIIGKKIKSYELQILELNEELDELRGKLLNTECTYKELIKKQKYEFDLCETATKQQLLEKIKDIEKLEMKLKTNQLLVKKFEALIERKTREFQQFEMEHKEIRQKSNDTIKMQLQTKQLDIERLQKSIIETNDEHKALITQLQYDNKNLLIQLNDIQNELHAKVETDKKSLDFEVPKCITVGTDDPVAVIIEVPCDLNPETDNTNLETINNNHVNDDDLTEKYHRLCTEHSKLLETYNVLDGEKLELEKQYDWNQKEYDRINKFHSEEIKRLTDALAKAQLQLIAVERQCQEKSDHIQQIAIAKQSNDCEIRKRMKKLQDELNGIRATESDKTREINKLKCELSKAQIDLKQQEETIFTHQQLLRVRSELISSMQKKDDTAKCCIAELQADVDKKMKWVKRLNNQVKFKSEELEDIFSTLAIKQMEVTRLSQIIQSLEENRKQLTIKIEHLERAGRCRCAANIDELGHSSNSGHTSRMNNRLIYKQDDYDDGDDDGENSQNATCKYESCNPDDDDDDQQDDKIEFKITSNNNHIQNIYRYGNK